MRSLRNGLVAGLVAGLCLSLFAASGCSAEAKFCDKMRSLYGDEMDDCEEDALPEIKAQCKDPDAVFKCVAKASDKEAADKCYEEKCDKK